MSQPILSNNTGGVVFVLDQGLWGNKLSVEQRDSRDFLHSCITQTYLLSNEKTPSHRGGGE